MISLLLNSYNGNELQILRHILNNSLIELSENRCAICGVTCAECSNRKICADLANAVHFIDTTIAKREN